MLFFFRCFLFVWNKFFDGSADVADRDDGSNFFDKFVIAKNRSEFGVDSEYGSGYVNADESANYNFATRTTEADLTAESQTYTLSVPLIKAELRYKDWYLVIRVFDNAGNSYVFSRLYEFDTQGLEIYDDYEHDDIDDDNTNIYRNDNGVFVYVDSDDENLTASTNSTIKYSFGIYDKWLVNKYVHELESGTIQHNGLMDLSKIHIVFSKSSDLTQGYAILTQGNSACASNYINVN